MSTNIFIALIVMGVVAVGGGGYLVYKEMNSESSAQVSTEVKKENTEDPESTETELPADDTVSGTFAALLGLGQSLVCQIANVDGTSSTNGTFYIAQGGERLRGDFTSVIAGNQIDSHIIRNDGYTYTWTSSLQQGARIKIEPGTEDQVSPNASSPIPVDDNTSYDCNPWPIDTSKFVLPADIQFIDLKAQMDAALNAGGAVDTASLKAAQCNACKQLTVEGAAAKCLAALACE